MAGMHIEREIVESDGSVHHEEETIWFRYETDACAAHDQMIDLHIEFEKRVPSLNANSQTVFEYADGSVVRVKVLPSYDKRGW